MSGFRLTGATVLTMNDDFDILHGVDVVVAKGRIVAIGQTPPEYAHLPASACNGDYILPGLVQPHIHLTQTLFRHDAEERHLMDWLRERIWPMEGAHDSESNRVSAELGIAELLLSGTTCILDMGTVHHQEAIFEAIEHSGLRASAGKAMMDAGQGVPDSLLETTRSSLDESVRLAKRWHGADDDRIRYAFAPRFVLSCTEELQQEVGRHSRESGYGIHTHSSEQIEEIEAVEAASGRRNVVYLRDLGLCSERSVFAHGIHLNEEERGILRDTRTSICHCPSSNLKLGSGICDVPNLLKEGVNVGIGADGAPCNNGLDGLVEMRLAHLLQAMNHEPGVLTPREVLRMATRNGARALCWEERIGSIEPGKDADMVRIRRDDLRIGLGSDPYTEIVTTGMRDLVRDVWVRGEHLVANGALTRMDAEELRVRGAKARKNVLERAFG